LTGRAGAARRSGRDARERKRFFSPERWLIFVFALYILVLGGYQEKTLRDLRARKAELVAAMREARRQNAELRRRLEYVRSPAYVEERARRELGYGRPGEVPLEVQSRPGLPSRGEVPGSR
jgi:cell division protein FtsB